ncbi:MAG: glutamine amidotransferase [Myxococcales bacterium]|nr:glutamine amidotransferase [Myxococcales bacterium]
MRPLLIVKTGCTLPSLLARRGDYEDWIRDGLGLAGERIEVASVHAGDRLPSPERLAGAVVTGSSAMVSEREPWSERAARWLATAVAAEVPLLGICYGHQLLAHGLGGRVGVNPRGREIGTVDVELYQGARDDPLLGGFTSPLRVQATHVESVLELPPAARLLAASAGDPNHVFAVGRSAWGVQFHPEFDADVTRAYIEERREILRREGLDPERLHRDVRDSADGRALLRRFAELLRA